jgi:glycosyltransferase involved in cell wall biosynthesis
MTTDTLNAATLISADSSAQSIESVAPFAVRKEFVSVVIPCFNEERFIKQVLANLADQYDEDRYEIIVVDGMSTDDTRTVIESFKQERPEISVRVLDNPSRHIPAALNIGTSAARGEIIARMDAHAVPSPGYVRRCVETLGQERCGVVGMPCRVRPSANTLMSKAIASAVSHPFGIGDAKYRLNSQGPAIESVDTVAFACFKKSLWTELKGFSESLLTNEDYDFNYRVRSSGYDVKLNRSGFCDYFARATLSGLKTQYSRYGFWKARMVRLHPSSIKLRHLVAPAFVLSLIVLALLGIMWWPALVLLAVEISSYILVSLICAGKITRANGGGLRMFLLMPLVFLTIHLSWGSHFLVGLLTK